MTKLFFIIWILISTSLSVAQIRGEFLVCQPTKKNSFITFCSSEKTEGQTHYFEICAEQAFKNFNEVRWCYFNISKQRLVCNSDQLVFQKIKKTYTFSAFSSFYQNIKIYDLKILPQTLVFQPKARLNFLTNIYSSYGITWGFSDTLNCVQKTFY